MENKEILTFIITDRKDNDFTDFIYRSNHIMDFGNGIVIHEPKCFITLLNQSKETLRFRVLVHLGLKNRDDAAGLMHLQTLKDFLKTDDFLIVSREMDYLFPNNESHTMWNGLKVFNANHINRKEFIKELTIFTKSEVIKAKDSKSTKPKDNNFGLDFAILTALSQDEYSAFRNKISEDLFESTTYIKGRFNKIGKLERDYLSNFILYRQNQMGMVDASICTNKIIHEFNPKFIIMGGVCGGRIGKIKRYDIIIPKQVIEFTIGKLDSGEIRTYDYSSKTRIDLHSWLSESNRIEELKNNMFSLIPASEKEYKTVCGSINISFDDLACVPWVIKTNEWLEENAKKYNEKIVALEMESYGVNRSYDLNMDKIVATLIVKSVMDYTDKVKTDSNPKTGENYKKTAGYMSYLCIRALMPMLLDFNNNLNINNKLPSII